jgi:hypothetical protein
VGKIILSLSLDVLGFRMLWHFVWWWALHHILCNAHQESRVVAWICQPCRLHSGYVHFTIVYCFIFRFFTFWSGSRIYLQRKRACLFCLSCSDLPKHGASFHNLGTIGKPLISSRGALSWFHNVLTYSGEDIEYWTIFSLKFQFN